MSKRQFFKYKCKLIEYSYLRQYTPFTGLIIGSVPTSPHASKTESSHILRLRLLRRERLLSSHSATRLDLA